MEDGEGAKEHKWDSKIQSLQDGSAGTSKRSLSGGCGEFQIDKILAWNVRNIVCLDGRFCHSRTLIEKILT